MTTIAYKDGVIAYDSRSTMDGSIVDDDCDKHAISNGVSFFIAGEPCHMKNLIESYSEGRAVGEFSSVAIVADQGEVFYIGSNQEGDYWKHPIYEGKVFAIGSGQDHAFTAMDMGASAKDAVKMALKRDTGTGGKVRTFRVKGR